MADYPVKRNDAKAVISGVCSDASGPVSLTGATVKFIMKKDVNGKPSSGTAKVNATATADPDQTANTGKVSYTFTAGDLDTKGKYLGEWQATFPGGKVQTFPNDSWIKIEVVEDLG